MLTVRADREPRQQAFLSVEQQRRLKLPPVALSNVAQTIQHRLSVHANSSSNR